ncbi:MAG: flagellar hook-basal body complex protein, partial [Desulfonatronovibrio sp.]
MGLSSSLYTGVSGLKGHGEPMGVIGNNISNVSTVGFKGSRMHFEDFISQDINTAAGVGQVGRGVSVGAVLADFQQGALETTNEATDVSIGGEGFFVVSPKGSEEEYYTRAGNFRFDKDGYLVDTKGNVVQGWSVREDKDTEIADDDDQVQATDSGVQIQGVPKDIELTNFQSPPEATKQVDMMANLDSNSVDRSTDEDNPFFAMFGNWNAEDDEPLGDNNYAYQSTIKVYDANGSSYNMTTYFDPVKDEEVMDASGGNRHWEYMVTVDPVNDNRNWDDPDDPKRG